MSEYVDFYGGPFSNFARSPITLPHPWAADRQFTYKTVEHYFQAAKATNRDDHDRVAYSSSATLAKVRGREVKLRSDWEEQKYSIMVAGLREKFKIPHFRDELLATGDAIIREDSPTDFVWGYRNDGQNLLGKALMQIRQEIIDGHN